MYNTNDYDSVILFSLVLFLSSYQLLYYVDETSHTIVQVSLSDPTKPEVPLITNEKDSINGIAVDWISGNIFYSDSGKIQQYHVTSGDMTPVLSNLSNPRGIVLMPDNPYRYVWIIDVRNICVMGYIHISNNDVYRLENI